MSTSRIVTITLSPSLDRTLSTHYLALGYHNLVEGTTRLDPAGAGVGISRALHRLHARTHGIILLGVDATARAYEALVRMESFPVTFLRSEGATRSDTIIRDTGHNSETHLVEESSPLTEQVLERVEMALRAIVNPEDTVVFTGPLPAERPEHTFRRLVDAVAQQGAHIVTALALADVNDVLTSGLALVSLTQLQAEVLFNFPVRGPDEVAYCAHTLRDKGIPAVLIEMPDTASAYLSSDDGDWLISLPEEESGTTSGVWEALLAGLLAGRSRRQPLGDALELGAAAASYTASQLGSKFGTRADINEHREGVDVTRIEEPTTDDDVQPPLAAAEES